MMEEQVNIEEVLKNMRETIGALAQENAILKAQIAQSTTE
jgi:ribosomal protein L12E/L44/L45/RPP1/RPP2